MIQNNDITNTEDVKVGNRPQRDEVRHVTVPKEQFLFKEPIVLTSIVCLSLFSGLSMYLQPRIMSELPSKLFSVYSVSTSAVPVVGSLFAAFLSEITGRKPVYRYLYALSIFSFIVIMSSKHETVLCLILVLNGMIRGGTLLMNALAISEYSSPKHRFAWMIVNAAVPNTVARVLSIMYLDQDIVFYVLLVIQIVLGLFCLGSTWVWPESPYWLASKGKFDQSRMAFMWLRGKGGREELASVLEARRRPGPPKLFWISLSIALPTIAVSIFSTSQVIQSSIFYRHFNPRTNEQKLFIILFSTTAISSTLAAVSYLMKRKLLFIVVSIISFTLSYAEALWLYLESESEVDSVLFSLLHIASDVVRVCGPAVFGVILFVEIAPYKYNTAISCICFIVMFISTYLLAHLSIYLFDKSFAPSALFALSTTFSLVAALLYFFLAPETKDKTLLEIQRSYTPDENYSQPEQNQSMVLNAML